MVAALLAFVAGCRQEMGLTEPAMTQTTGLHYYQLVLIRVADAPKFGRYLELMRPIVLKYGGALERMLAPDTIYAEGMTKPEIANIVYYDSKDAFRAFNEDPEFRKIAHLRSESIEMAAVNGLPVEGDVTQADLSKRLYLVEVARYNAGIDGYRQYERDSVPVMARYGYHVERLLEPDSATGFSFEPNVVRIAYFESADGMARMQKDPDHERLDKLYAAGVSNSVWLIARVHPSTLTAPAHPDREHGRAER
jgi:uncharacterized protein (DUF1330 family)